MNTWRLAISFAVGLLTALVYAGIEADLIFTDSFENQVPIITSSPVTTASVGSLYSYDVDATDIDADSLIYMLTTSPDGMLINTASGEISWLPDNEGVFPVVV